MKNFLLLFIISMTVLCTRTHAQCIPDLNFQQAISDVCPQCISANGCLLPYATTITELLVDNHDITDITGIEGFTNLKEFRCSGNSISTIPLLPDSLEIFYCSNNLITSLPAMLPTSLREFKCENNYITALPALPNLMILFFCSGNALSDLPLLPENIENLTCNDNYLMELPPLPASLTALHCNVNQITRLPELPPNLQKLFCSQNPISVLPVLPASLKVLDISYTFLTCLPELPYDLQFFNYAFCDITCLPNFPGIFETGSPLPLCVNGPGDSCALYPVISGTAFVDYDGDAFQDTNDIGFPNLNVLVGSENWMGYTKSNGEFRMNVGFENTYTPAVAMPAGNYSITSLPQMVTFDNTTGQVINNLNFAIHPETNIYDLSVELTPGLLTPGVQALYYVTYENKCPFILNGYVQLFYDSNINFLTADVQPSFQNGKKLKWVFTGLPPFCSRTITVRFDIPASVLAGTKLKQSLYGIIPNQPDIDSLNNTSSDSSEVQMDLIGPNYKTVSNISLSPYDIAAEKELTYTIYYQNNENTKTKNLDVYDTLSSGLQASEFDVLASSDSAVIEVGNDVTNPSHRLILHLKYPAIDLPASINDPFASQGFVKFSVKPFSTLGDGDNIYNRAFLQFSNSPALINTNTVVTHIEYPVLVTDPSKDLMTVSVYPNPFDNLFELDLQVTRSENLTISIYNTVGQLVWQHALYVKNNLSLPINTEGLIRGSYVLQVIAEDMNVTRKIWKL